MTLWPEPDSEENQGEREMWDAYRRKTARPASLPDYDPEQPAPEPPGGENAGRRGRLPASPSSTTDA